MIIVMDKKKEHSCAIQPVFGYGGTTVAGVLGGTAGLLGGAGAGILANFTFMLEQVFNVGNFVSPAAEGVQADPLVNFPLIEEMVPITGTLQVATGSVANVHTQNAPPTHHALQTETVVNESNNAHQPHLSASEAIQNAFLEYLTPPSPQPTGTIEILSHGFELPSDASGTTNVPVIHVNLLQPNATLPNQPQTHISETQTTAAQNIAAAAHPGIIESIASQPEYIEQFHQLNAHSDMLISNLHSPVPPDEESNSSVSSLVISNLHSPVPPNEESNSSVPSLHAPFSSPVHLFFPNNFNASDDEVYGPSVSSTIHVIDYTGNSGSVSENQINNSNVPN